MLHQRFSIQSHVGFKPTKLGYMFRWSLNWSSAQVKICQIPHVNFETTSRFLSKFCIIFKGHER